MSFKEDINKPNVDFRQRSNSVMPDAHYHLAYEIYITEMNHMFWVENQLLNLKERDVLLIKPNVLHRSISEEHFYSLIELPVSYFEKYFTKCGTELITACFETNIIRVRESDFKQLLYCTERLSENSDDLIMLIQLLSILKSNMLRKTSTVESQSSLSFRITDFVTKNFKTIGSLTEIADTFYISKGYLCSLFKKQTGTSVGKYINSLKVFHSLELFSQTNLSMEQIALESGFISSSNFSKAFKSVMGTTPLKYRKENFSCDDV